MFDDLTYCYQLHQIRCLVCHKFYQLLYGSLTWLPGSYTLIVEMFTIHHIIITPGLQYIITSGLQLTTHYIIITSGLQ